MIITIARQCGCGAVEVGRLLSARYGIPFYTRTDLLEMARRRGLEAAMADFFEERPVDELLFSISSYGEERTALTERPLKALAEMIGSESCIIIGRCGNHIFRQRPDLVSVFLGGGERERIAHIMREQQLTPSQAQDFVEQMDDRRAAYHKYYTGLQWGAAADYDLCLDTVRLGADATARIISDYADAVISH